MIERGQRHQSVQAAFEFAHVGKNVLSDVLSDVRRQDERVAALQNKILLEVTPGPEYNRRVSLIARGFLDEIFVG